MIMMRSLAAGISLVPMVLLTACGRGSGSRNQQNTSSVTPNANEPADQSSGAATPPAEEDADQRPPVPYRHFDVNHILSTGQSNSVAHEGRPVLTTSQPYGNLMFDVGVMTSGACEADGCRTYEKPKSFVPLMEGDTFWYPVETMSSSLANLTTKLATETYGKSAHDVLVSLAGRNGLTYWCLRQGGCNFLDPTYVNTFDESMRQVDDAFAIAKAEGKSYVVRAVTVIHGESDDYAYATNTSEFPLDGTDGAPRSIKSYADALAEWQRDYDSGVKARTGQTEPVVLLFSQHSGWNDVATSTVAMNQYDAHVKSDGKVVLVTAGYPLDYNDDCRHYSNHGERQLGEYFAKVYARIVIAGERWEPVHPKKTTRVDRVITATFHVPKPPLVLDTDRVKDPGHYGFEVVDAAGNRLAISNVALSGPNKVAITLDRAPVSTARLRYAYTTTPQGCPGKQTGARGNLRDSDDTPSRYGYDLFNWAVHFEVPVN